MSQHMRVTRVLIVGAAAGLALGIVVAMIFFFNIVNVRTALAGTTTYYSIKAGNWETPGTWSTSGYTGTPAANYPQAGDIVYIQGYAITIANQNVACASLTILGSGRSNALLTISNGKILTTSSDVVLNGNNTSNYADITLTGNKSSLVVGGSFTAMRSSSSVAIKLTMNPHTIANISGGLSLTSTGGSNGISVNMDTSAVLTVGGKMTLLESGNSGNIELIMKNKATATIKDTINIDYVSGKGNANISLTNNSVLNAYKSVVLSAGSVGNSVINCTGSTINIKGNFIRKASPNNYGKMSCTGGSNLIFSGSASQIFPMGYSIGSDTFKFDTVTINNTCPTSPQVTLEGSSTIVSGIKFIKGIVKSSSADVLTLGTSCVVSGMNTLSYVDGPVTKASCKDAFTFPIGKGGKLGLLTISKPSATANYTAEYFFSAYSNTRSFDNTLTDVSLKEYWSLTNSKASNGNSTVTVGLVYNNASESGVTSGKNTVVASWNTTSGMWKNYGNNAIIHNNSGILVDTSSSANSDSSTVYSTSVISPNGFFTFGSIGGNNPLPVKLLYFNATALSGKIHLSWATASEINNDHFEIQRSKDGLSFAAIGTIRGAGNSTEVLDYSYDDFGPQIGTTYYRLKQVDDNGNFEYSPIDQVNFNSINSVSTTIGPNPFTNSFRVTFSQEQDGPVDMLIANLAGQVVYREAISANKGENNFQFNDNIGLPSGIYFLQLTRNGMAEETHKIIKY